MNRWHETAMVAVLPLCLGVSCSDAGAGTPSERDGGPLDVGATGDGSTSEEDAPTDGASAGDPADADADARNAAEPRCRPACPAPLVCNPELLICNECNDHRDCGAGRWCRSAGIARPNACAFCDADGDGFLAEDLPAEAASCVGPRLDCDDASPAAVPRAPAICNNAEMTDCFGPTFAPSSLVAEVGLIATNGTPLHELTPVQAGSFSRSLSVAAFAPEQDGTLNTMLTYLSQSPASGVEVVLDSPFVAPQLGTRTGACADLALPFERIDAVGASASAQRFTLAYAGRVMGRAPSYIAFAATPSAPTTLHLDADACSELDTLEPLVDVDVEAVPGGVVYAFAAGPADAVDAERWVGGATADGAEVARYRTLGINASIHSVDVEPPLLAFVSSRDTGAASPQVVGIGKVAGGLGQEFATLALDAGAHVRFRPEMLRQGTAFAVYAALQTGRVRRWQIECTEATPVAECARSATSADVTDVRIARDPLWDGAVAGAAGPAFLIERRRSESRADDTIWLRIANEADALFGPEHRSYLALDGTLFPRPDLTPARLEILDQSMDVYATADGWRVVLAFIVRVDSGTPQLATLYLDACRTA